MDLRLLHRELGLGGIPVRPARFNCQITQPDQSGRQQQVHIPAVIQRRICSSVQGRSTPPSGPSASNLVCRAAQSNLTSEASSDSGRDPQSSGYGIRCQA